MVLVYMKDGEMDLIAQLLLESRIGTYIEWLDNELIMTTNKVIRNIHKDSLLVMIFAKSEPSNP